MKKQAVFLIVAAILVASVGWMFLGEQGEIDTAQAGTPLAEVKVPTLSKTALEGETIFNANCAACHGKNGAGVDGAGPPLVHVIYEPNHHADIAFYVAVKQGVRAHHWRFGNMPPVPDVGEHDVAKIITYIRELQRANGIN